MAGHHSQRPPTLSRSVGTVGGRRVAFRVDSFAQVVGSDSQG